MKELGIYGGTFSPPHKGHMRALKSFCAQVRPDIMLVIPTAIPPHKAEVEGASPEQRIDMLDLAVRDSFSDADGGNFSDIRISDYEIRKSGKSYTAETLTYFSGLYMKPEWRISFLCGTDMFITLDRWYHPETVFDKARIAFMRREEHGSGLDRLIEEKKEQYRSRFNADIIEIEDKAIEISSSELRSRIKEKRDISEFVSPSVADYIISNKLYI